MFALAICTHVFPAKKAHCIEIDGERDIESVCEIDTERVSERDRERERVCEKDTERASEREIEREREGEHTQEECVQQ